MSGPRATVLVPATVGNVGVGFDVLGLAVEGLGDEVTVELVAGPSSIGDVSGVAADRIPRDPQKNCAVIAAEALLRAVGDSRGARVSLLRRLPLSGGLGGSAAASLGGALAAAYALTADARVTATGQPPLAPDAVILAAALEGEAAVAGRHLDNIAPCFYGGLCLVAPTDPPAVHRLPVAGAWWVALVTPTQELRTADARAVLPVDVPRAELIRQLAAMAGLVAGFATSDAALVRRTFEDAFAEPRRAPLIHGFAAVKAAALAAGAVACSISGAGPTVFALTSDRETAEACSRAMSAAFPATSLSHVGRVAPRGAHLL